MALGEFSSREGDAALSLVGKTIWARLPNAVFHWVRCSVTASPARGLITLTYYDPDAYNPDNSMMSQLGPQQRRGKDVTLTVELTAIQWEFPRQAA